jgi:GNAT superfamily N-acetyltransferase
MLGSTAKIVVRRAKPSDAKAVASIFGDAWTTSYRGIIPLLTLDGMVRRRGPEWWGSAIRSGDGILVLELDRVVVGYASCGRARSRSRYQGEIYELYILPSHQGLGLGEWLFEGCRHTLDERSLNGLVVWALADNAPAIDFYWRRGGRPFAQSKEKIGGSKLDKIAFGWD